MDFQEIDIQGINFHNLGVHVNSYSNHRLRKANIADFGLFGDSWRKRVSGTASCFGCLVTF